MPPLTHAVHPCVNKTTHVGFNVQKIDGLSLGDTKMPTEISEFLRVFLNRQQNLGASDFCSHSIFPAQQLLIHTEAPHIDLSTCVLRLDVRHVWIHTTCLLVLRKHYVCAEAFIFLLNGFAFSVIELLQDSAYLINEWFILWELPNACFFFPIFVEVPGLVSVLLIHDYWKLPWWRSCP